MAPPLAGLKVVELARVLAGPWAGQVLADLGADVIKVESPAGDDTRRWGPPFVDNGDGTGDAAYFHACNRGKRSIAIDFRKPEGRDVVRRLAGRSDVIIENFKVGALARFGLDYPSLKAINPAIVYCSITGFGQDGPYAERPGYDFVIQAMGGLMDLTGAPDGEPQKVGVAYADIFTGLYTVIAIQAALAERQRTGQGQLIDMALLDTQVGVLANQAMNYLVSGVAPRRLGNAHPNIVPYETFATADGEIAVGVGSERQWPRFCMALGLPALADDPRFATNGARVERRAELRETLAERLAERTSAEWLELLDRADVPAGPINDVVAAFASPAAVARSMRVPLEHALLGRVDQVGIPFELSRTPGEIRTPPPLLGEQGDEILAELGYEPADIERLRRDGIV
jgi:crotonobetainyl-CoA:carnitine CoA-transferase CaiB-like acyl-CoA transferase